MSSAQTRRSTTRTVAVLFQVVVFISSIFGPLAVFAEEPPLPDPIPSEAPSEPPASEPPASEPPAESSASDPAADVPVSTPTITTDKGDYAPTEIVVITGTAWNVAEAVRLFVNDHDGETWNHSADVVADDTGSFTYSFELPWWFVARYTVSATGASGSSATTTFTDAVLPARGCPAGSPIVVTTTADQFDAVGASATGCSLREAINAANGDGNADVITLPAGTYTLTRTGAGEDNNSTGDLDILQPLTINGAGARTTIIQAGTDASNGIDRVLHAQSSAALTLGGVTIQFGRVNGAEGGGLLTNRPTTLTDVTIANNQVTGSDRHGGGISHQGEQLTLNRVTISNNTATGQGGGLHTGSGNASITNATITNNTAASGGGIRINSDTKTLVNVTVSHNSAPQGSNIRQDSGAINLRNTIVSDGSGSNNCSGTIGNAANNLDSGSSCGFGAANNSKSNANAALGALQNNGGPTDTRALGSGSAAIDAGTATSAPSIDQRGIGRPTDGDGNGTATHDIGAYEAPAPPANTAPVCQDRTLTTNEDTTGSVAPSCTDADGNPLTYSIVANATNGTASVVSGQLQYVPNANFFGSDSFTYRANDGPANSNTATVTVTVNAVNDAPSFTKGSNQTVSEDAGPQSVSNWATNILSGPANESGQTVSFIVTNNTNAGLFSTGPAVSSSGTLTYSAASNAHGSATITLKAKDNGGTANGGVDESPTQSFTITVNPVNDAPVVTLSATNDLSVDEGSTVTYHFAISDPEGDTISDVTVDCGAGGSEDLSSVDFSNLSDATFDCEWGDGDADGTLSTISASATDSDDATGDADTQDVTINNVAPTVTLSATNDLSVDEGSTVTYHFAISDPSPTDTISDVTVDCGAGGSEDLSSVDFSNLSDATFDCEWGDGDADGTLSTISASATDSDDATGDADTQDVTINNVAPTVTLSATNDLSVDEGSTVTYHFAISDPSPTDTISDVTVDCGAGGSEDLSSVDFSNLSDATFDCEWGDGDADGTLSTISASATDSDDATGDADTQDVTINNVAPTVTLSATNDLSVDEGSTVTYHFAISDPSPTDTISDVTVDCGAGGSEDLSSVDFSNLSDATFDCEWGDGDADGTLSTISASATDSDDATGDADTQDVTINNVAPTVTLSATNDLSIDEGSTVTYHFAISDPSPTDTISDVTVDCGAGGSEDLSSVDFSNLSDATFDCEWGDGDADGTLSTISASATDSDDATGDADTQDVTINNVAPTAMLNSSASAIVVGQPVTFTGLANDPSPPDQAAGFQWAFDTGSGFGPFGTSNSVTLTPTSCGSITVRAMAQDKDSGISDVVERTVSIYEASFLSPLKEGVRNLVQAGRVVPVQIRFGCNGHISGLSPSIQLLVGDYDVTTDPNDPAFEIATLSVSGADNTGVMREVDSKYIYNLRIPDTYAAGQRLTIRVRPFGPTSAPSMYILLEVRR